MPKYTTKCISRGKKMLNVFLNVFWIIELHLIENLNNIKNGQTLYEGI